jgi:tripartite-type tricarboxylate transporter receptor subunit TctC
MWLFRFLAVLLLAAFSAVSFSQEWPGKPVKFVSPYPPGGSVDPLARLFAAKLGDALKQNFIVENRTGASGIIGTEYVAKSAPDGYTFVFIFDTHAVHQALNPKLPFDPLKDFAPVMIVGTAPMTISTGAAKPYRSFQDVLAAAKAKPDSVTIGNVGNGSLGHLASILVGQAAGVKLVPVPYKGGGPLHVDALGGQIDLAIASVAAQASHVKGGKLRALVQTGEKRSALMPDVPTLAEAGVRGVDPAYAFWGILAPAGTPRPIIDKLAGWFNQIVASEETKQFHARFAIDPLPGSPESMAALLKTEVERWGGFVKLAKIQPQ